MTEYIILDSRTKRPTCSSDDCEKPPVEGSKGATDPDLNKFEKPGRNPDLVIAALCSSSSSSKDWEKSRGRCVWANNGGGNSSELDDRDGRCKRA